jgi:CHAD domain-containing protein
MRLVVGSALPLPPGGQPRMRTKNADLEIVLTALRAQLGAIRAHERGTRTGRDPEDLHEMRVAVRRLRAILRASRAMFEREWTAGLRSELEWLGSALGHVRDLDVLLASLRSRLEGLPAAEGRIGALLLGDIEKDCATARARLHTALAGPRYRRLLRRLDAGLRRPPVVEADVSLRDVAAREFEKLRSAVKDLPRHPADEDLHAVRIKVKRARYAAELVREAVGRPARRFLEQARAVQDVLGEHQDSVVLERRLCEAPARSGDLHRITGKLVALERRRRARKRAAFREEWPALTRRGRKAWR